MFFDMTLSAFARRYTQARDLSPVYVGTLCRRAAALELHAGGGPIASILTETKVNGFLASLGVVSPYTFKSYRGDLLTLWNSAADEGLASYPMGRRIMSRRAPALVVECYDVSEARALVEYANRIGGELANGVPQKLYWPAAIRTAWDSALRRSDIWRVRRDYIRPDGSLRLAQHKTGLLVRCQLRMSTVVALYAIGSPVPLYWPHNPWTFGEQFRKIVKASGVGRGTFKFFRRSSGSYVEAAAPGSGHLQLGNTQSVFAAHYDAKLGGVSWPQPPEL